MADNELGALAAALSKAQAAFPLIPRDKEVTVQLDKGGSYKFKYAPLESILNLTRTALSENGLAVSQLLDSDADGMPALVTMLLHEGGGSLSARTPIPFAQGGKVQVFGSAVTYVRRYAIQALLGITAEEDDDGNAADGNTATFKERRDVPKPDPVRVLTRADEPELIGPWSGTGVIGVKKGTADGLLRQSPEGGLVIVTFTTTEERVIPQAVFRGALAVDVLDAAGSMLKGLVGTLEGDLYRVPYWVGEQKVRREFDRLEVSRIVTAGWTLPLEVAPSVELFSEDELESLDAAIGA